MDIADILIIIAIVVLKLNINIYNHCDFHQDR